MWSKWTDWENWGECFFLFVFKLLASFQLWLLTFFACYTYWAPMKPLCCRWPALLKKTDHQQNIICAATAFPGYKAKCWKVWNKRLWAASVILGHAQCCSTRAQVPTDPQCLILPKSDPTICPFLQLLVPGHSLLLHPHPAFVPCAFQVLPLFTPGAGWVQR